MRLSALEPRWLIVAAFFVVGIFLGGLTIYLWLGTATFGQFKVHSTRSYEYINPLLAVDIPQGRVSTQNRALELRLQSLIDNQKRSGSIAEASIYFRDLEPGLWVGVDENAKFSPGNLLTVPLMIAYYKLAETDPSILDGKILFKGGEPVTQQLLKPKESLTLGTSYTVEELIERMIVDSDNNAAALLFDNIEKESLDEVFSDLGISFKEEKATEDYISVKLDSLFYRVLYNATYLNRNYSEKALELLVKTPSVIGVGTELPRSIVFADREGGRTFVRNGITLLEVYDCGIVYYPSHPYLLCAAAQGKDLESVKGFMRGLGQRVYAEVDYEYSQ